MAQKSVFITCPHCDRKFGQKAADRHINWCKEKAKIEHIKRQGSALREAAMKKAKNSTPVRRSALGSATARDSIKSPKVQPEASQAPLLTPRSSHATPLFKQSTTIGQGVYASKFFQTIQEKDKSQHEQQVTLRRNKANRLKSYGSVG